jgi:hypothetical protein
MLTIRASWDLDLDEVVTAAALLSPISLSNRLPKGFGAYTAPNEKDSSPPTRFGRSGRHGWVSMRRHYFHILACPITCLMILGRTQGRSENG